jgi:hypothetical protein
VLAEFDVEIGGDAPTLVIPWSADDGSCAFFDLAENPGLIDKLPESRDPELRNALIRLNTAGGRFMTAKCDLWTTRDLSDEEMIFDSEWKFASYTDVLWREDGLRADFSRCESVMRAWVERLRAEAQDFACVGFVLRACKAWKQQGFYWTVYASGFGATASEARTAWGKGLRAVIRILEVEELESVYLE